MISQATVSAALVGVAVVGFGTKGIQAQSPGNALPKESVNSVDADLFRVRVARLRLQAARVASEDAAYVEKLLADAEKAYRAGDLELADVRLLEAEVYLETFASPDSSAAAEETERADSLADLVNEEPAFHLQAFAGLDLWRERLAVESALTSGESGATGSGNPASGLRADFSAAGALATAQGYTEARTSRDYAYAMADLNLTADETPIGQPRVEFRLSGTDYHRQSGVDYFQIRILSRWDLHMLRTWTLTPLAELGRMRYAQGESSLFDDFNEVVYGLRTNTWLPTGVWLEAEARRAHRHYGSTLQSDFDGTDASTGIGFASSKITSTFWLGYQARDFEPTSASWSSDGSYRDFYADARLRWLMHRPWGVEVRLGLERRSYRVLNPATPDFFEASLRVFGIWQPEFGRQISAGPTYRWRSSPDFAGAKWSRWEDYRSWGVGVDVELLRGQHWTLFLTNTFESRVHPYGPPDDVPGLSLYDDRFVSNSLLLFSWQFAEGWEVTVTVNLDREDDRRQAEGDVQSTLASVQCVRDIF